MNFLNGEKVEWNFLFFEAEAARLPETFSTERLRKCWRCKVLSALPRGCIQADRPAPARASAFDDPDTNAGDIARSLRS